ncbi:MAG TPA: PIG-L deacetylase family protein [Candidatus Methylomirabilis sp.]|nr:PIG-L deacetylase family protein [Candidatus Methylomirabilis sp.]
MTAREPEGDAGARNVAERRKSAKKSTPEPPAPGRVLSIHAHPDDQEFTVAGTLAKWTRAGSTVITVCITSGEAGSNGHTPETMTRQALVPIREQEQRDACAVLGISEVLFLGYEDGVLQPSIALRRDLTRIVRRYRPEVVVCGDPTVRFYGANYMNHPDHRAAADAVLDAVFPSAETRFIFPELLDEGLAPHKVHAVFISGSEHPDTFIDIGDTIEIKVAALKQHKSQMGSWDPTEMITGWARLQGARRKLKAAESYRVMRLHES